MTQKKSHKTQKQEKAPMNGEEKTAPEEKEVLTDETMMQEEVCEEARQDAEDEKELLKRQIEDLNDKHLRLIAEYDNYRKRTVKEKTELIKYAGERIIVDLLPVIDDFERALQHLDDAKDIEALKKGINLIYSKFQEYLRQQGVALIEVNNEPFDSEIHEAVTKIPAPSEKMKGKVVDCILKGYKLNDRVIRHPKVVIGE